MGPQFVTIPNNGNGVATDADIWKHTNPKSWGCKVSISHDGSICSYNPGYDQFPTNGCGCIADEGCLLRHKCVVLLPFQEETAPSLAWQTVLEQQMAVSINWAPRKYLYLSSTDTTHGESALSSNFWSDFKGWCYTNDSTYLACDGNALPNAATPRLICDMADSGTIWLVHYPTNTWTRILKPLTPVGRGTLLAFAAVWIDKTMNTITPLPEQSSGISGAFRYRTAYLVDIRGRIVSKAQTARKLVPGVYYSRSPGGMVKRIFVDR